MKVLKQIILIFLLLGASTRLAGDLSGAAWLQELGRLLPIAPAPRPGAVSLEHAVAEARVTLQFASDGTRSFAVNNEYFFSHPRPVKFSTFLWSAYFYRPADEFTKSVLRREHCAPPSNSAGERRITSLQIRRLDLHGGEKTVMEIQCS